MPELSPETLLWLIPGGPLLAALVTAVFGGSILRGASHWPCWIGLAVSAASAAAVCWSVVPAGFVESGASAPAVASGYTWMQVGSLRVAMDLRADALAAQMLTMVTTVSLLVAVFSRGYMRGDAGYARYFAAVSLFVFSMCMLVLSGNFLQLFIFWELVGLCSYLLIGFWFQRPSAAAAAKKAFVINRVGDFGLLMGVLLIWTTFGTLDFQTVLFNPARLAEVAAASPGKVTLICLALLLGAMGKSAQFPLHVWLPDAMEGPTPVSALIHAATMVTAGVYLMARCGPLLACSTEAQLAVSGVGGVTALLAALIALTQHDLKRVLAYSTVSQLGYMFMALGVGAADPTLQAAGVTAAMFHLWTHGVFKALLFLSAGSVMHAMGDVIDMRRFGGLRHALPITHWTFLVGAAALAGIPPLAGFWSKDEILTVLAEAAHAPRYGGYFFAIGTLAVVTALLTAFYTFRAYFLTFWGDELFPDQAGEHPHDASPAMAWPLRLLAVGAIAAGVALAPTGWFAGYIAHTPGWASEHPHAINWGVIACSVGAAALGLGIAWWMYVLAPRAPVVAARIMGPLYGLSRNKMYLDEVLGALFVAPLVTLGWLSSVVDNHLLDPLLNALGFAPKTAARLPALTQHGATSGYALVMWGGLLGSLLLVMFTLG